MKTVITTLAVAAFMIGAVGASFAQGTNHRATKAAVKSATMAKPAKKRSTR